MEKFRLNGKNLFLIYPTKCFHVNDLIEYLTLKLNNKIINNILVGINKTKIYVFISLEKKFDLNSKDCFDLNKIEGEYKVSVDVSLNILQILQSDKVKIQGECHHPVYLLHQIKEKEKETMRNEFQVKLQEKEKELILKENEKELQKNEFQTKLKEKEKELILKENEFIHKLQENEKDFVHKLQEKEKEIELLKFKEDFMNKSYERIKSQNENLMNSFLSIKENINENQKENRFDNMLNNISDASGFLATINREFKKINDFSENNEIKKIDELFENNKNENKENYNDENNNKDCLKQSK